MQRYHFLLPLVLCLATCGPAIDNRPNFVIFMPDDQSYETIGAYGNDWVQSPNLDRLAAEGIRFNRAFVTNSLCAPSRASVLTGLYSHTHGVATNRVTPPGSGPTGVTLSKEFVTFPEILQDHGYETAFIGKIHVEPWLRDREFDYYFAFEDHGAYRNPKLAEVTNRVGPYEDVAYPGYLIDIITEHAVEYLKQDRDKPFCLLFWHKAPHSPLDPHARYRGMYGDHDFQPPETWTDDYTGKPKVLRDREPVKDTPEARKAWGNGKRLYYQLLAGVDDSVGEVLNALDNLGIADNTVVIHTSDNGMNMGHHGLADKRFMYEASIRVPFIVRYPKLVTPNVDSDHMILNIDMAPTVLDMAGVSVPDFMHGRSILPILKGEPVEWRKEWLYEYYEYPWWGEIPPFRGIRTDQYKYVFWYSRWPWERELYDLHTDPNEMHNLANDPQYADLIEQLHERMQELRRETNDPDIGKN